MRLDIQMKLRLTYLLFIFNHILFGQLPKQETLKINKVYLIIGKSTSDKQESTPFDTHFYIDTLGQIVKEVNYFKNQTNDSMVTIYSYKNNRLVHEKRISEKDNYLWEQIFVDSASRIINIKSKGASLTQKIKLDYKDNTYKTFINDTLSTIIKFTKSKDKRTYTKKEIHPYLTSYSFGKEYLDKNGQIELSTVKVNRKGLSQYPIKKKKYTSTKKFKYDDRSFLIQTTDFHTSDNATTTTIYSYYTR